MVIDCFTFFNELELLEIRLEELRGVVDWFVLVEAAQTFRGRPKDLVFEASQERFSGYPICHVKIGAFPDGISSPWEREAHSRNALAAGLRQIGPAPGDVVLLSDVDEIPRAEAVLERTRALEMAPSGTCYVFEQNLSYYFVNCLARDPWHGTRMARYGEITTLQNLRAAGGEIVQDGGWHFSYLGGADRIREKIGAYSHSELDRPEYTDVHQLQRCLEEARDPFGRDLGLRFVALDYSFPRSLVENRVKFAHLIREHTAKEQFAAEAQRTQRRAEELMPERVRTDGVMVERARADGVMAGRLYAAALERASDIREHLPYLYRLASTVREVTELGTRSGQSTSAFLLARPDRLVTYDVERHEAVAALEEAARELGIGFEYRQKDVLEAEIEPTDLLLIDTWHVEEQMREELRRHAGKARRYLALHDTETFAHRGETEGHGGIWPAIAGFMREHPEWLLLQHFPHNNGLTVFVRVGKPAEG